MSATTFDNLFKLRGQLEQGIGASLAEDLATYNRTNSATFQKERARFEIAVTIGAPLGHKKIITPTDRRYDMWNFNMSLTVVSGVAANIARNEGESDADFATRESANNGYHAQLVAHVDSYASGLQLASKDDFVNFPVLTLLMLQRNAIPSELKPQQGYETSALNFTGQFGIRPEAWTV